MDAENYDYINPEDEHDCEIQSILKDTLADNADTNFYNWTIEYNADGFVGVLWKDRKTGFEIISKTARLWYDDEEANFAIYPNIINIPKELKLCKKCFENIIKPRSCIMEALVFRKAGE